MTAGPYRALWLETRRKGEDNMRKTATVIGLLAAAAAFTWANAATVSYKATLASNAEVPPVQSPGKGSAQVNVDTATSRRHTGGSPA